MTRRAYASALLCKLTILLSCLVLIAGSVKAQTLPKFDFTRPETGREWHAAHDISHMEPTQEGLQIAIHGDDPYVFGPARDFPAGQLLWMHIRLRSEQGGMGQVFYFTAQKGANETDSVRFPVQGNRWVELRVPMPSLGARTYLRFDPPGDSGSCMLATLAFEARPQLQEPAWPPLLAPAFRNAMTVRSGDLEVRQNSALFGGFQVTVAGKPMGIGYDRPLIGYQSGNRLRWLDLAQKGKTTLYSVRHRVTVETRAQDAGGATWTLAQTFAAQSKGIAVSTDITVSQDRRVVFAPLLIVLPGASYPGKPSSGIGQEKLQALFAGLEYLDKNEPSSSEADIIGPESKRQVPDTHKITFPLMAIAAQDRYLGLIWQPQPRLSALFDSPDRLFHAGGHAMGLLFPGSSGGDREEGRLLPYDGAILRAHHPLHLTAMLIGGYGKSVVPAVQQYVALHPIVAHRFSASEKRNALALLSVGWTASKSREGSRYRHAYPGTFAPQPAADAALWMDYLATENADGALRTQVESTLAQVPPGDYNFAGIGHNHSPVESLAFGHTQENAARAQEVARGLLSRFQADGSVLYEKPAKGPDLGRTHFARDANGLTAQVVTTLLENAVFCGDPGLIRSGLQYLRALDKFANTVPRGAQTWEVPLHTPDILASAFLVRAYTLGYALTQEPHFLEQARYWAWTGVPFVYLGDALENPVGQYATIAVFGATQWIAPVWMGRPVQWCGLVYADALYRLLQYDPQGPWKTLADGITDSGLAQTWPAGSNPERQGLLPDSITLPTLIRNDPAINPATLEAEAIQRFNLPAVYDYHVFRANGLIVHAPGAITTPKETQGQVSFTVQGWPNRPYEILVVGLKAMPHLRIDNVEAPLTSPNLFDAATGRLILRVQGHPEVRIFTR